MRMAWRTDAWGLSMALVVFFGATTETATNGTTAVLLRRELARRIDLRAETITFRSFTEPNRIE